jgi:hypothetical protein
MNFDLCIQNNDLTIYCSTGLEKFSKEFINYYNEHISGIKSMLSIDTTEIILLALTDSSEQVNFVYSKSDFSGFFNDKGAFAYINLKGSKTKVDIFKGLMHELTHHLYKYYVYGADKSRITWVDEGIAQFFSGQKDELNDKEKYHLFVEENLNSIENINLNALNHNDKSFGNNNGYNLSYIAVRYLYETNNLKEFVNIIKNQEKLLQLGNIILPHIQEHYGVNTKHI